MRYKKLLYCLKTRQNVTPSLVNTITTETTTRLQFSEWSYTTGHQPENQLVQSIDLPAV